MRRAAHARGRGSSRAARRNAPLLGPGAFRRGDAHTGDRLLLAGRPPLLARDRRVSGRSRRRRALHVAHRAGSVDASPTRAPTFRRHSSLPSIARSSPIPRGASARRASGSRRSSRRRRRVQAAASARASRCVPWSPSRRVFWRRRACGGWPRTRFRRSASRRSCSAPAAPDPSRRSPTRPTVPAQPRECRSAIGSCFEFESPRPAHVYVITGRGRSRVSALPDGWIGASQSASGGAAHRLPGLVAGSRSRGKCRARRRGAFRGGDERGAARRLRARHPGDAPRAGGGDGTLPRRGVLGPSAWRRPGKIRRGDARSSPEEVVESLQRRIAADPALRKKVAIRVLTVSNAGG